MGILIFIVILAAFLLIGLSIAMSRQQAINIAVRYGGQNEGNKRNLFQADKLAAIIPFTRNFLEKSGLGFKIKMKLDAARVNLTSQAFLNIKILVMVAGCALLVVFTRRFDPVFLLIVLGLSYFVPDLYLKCRITRRKKDIVRVLPETVDLLGLCIEAGLDFTSAVKWVIEKIPANPLMEDLAFVLEEIKWGKPRIQALKDMSRRLEIPEISSFVQTIIQAERMGTPVAEAFTILSEDARAQRFHRGERIALQAPIKILLPLIFFIMPVIGIVIGGPILLQFMTGGLLTSIK